jgi:RHS repeat-associated protein
MLLRGVSGNKAARRSKNRRSKRLICEPLEQRILLTVNFWANPSGGDWDTATNWSLGHVPLSTEDVQITLAGTYTVTHSQSTSDSVNSIVSNEALTLSAGTLSVATTVQVNNTFTLSGGTLAGGTILAGTGGQGLTATTNSILNGVTVDSNLELAQTGNAKLTIDGGLVLNGTMFVGNATSSDEGTVAFGSSSQAAGSLTGTGTVVFGEYTANGLENASNQAGAAGTLIIGPNITIEGNTGSIETAPGDTNGNIVNQGVIDANTSGGTIALSASSNGTLSNTGTMEATGGTLNISSAWSNTGTLALTSGALDLGGTFTIADVGTFNRSGGTVNLTGTLNNTGTTLTLNSTTGVWTLLGGTILGGTISDGTVGGGGTFLAINNEAGTLSGVTVNGDLDLSEVSNSHLTIDNGLVLNGTMYLGNATNSDYGYLAFGNSSNAAGSLTGTGTVMFGESTANGLENASNQAGAAGTLTIGQNIIIEGNTGSIETAPGDTNGSIVNQGVINSSTAGGSITVSDGTGSVSNTGTMEATAGALDVVGLAGNAADVAISGTGTLSLNGTNYVLNDPLTLATGQTVTLAGSWSDSSTFNMTGGTLNLGGSFTQAGLGTFSSTGGTVNLTGTLTGNLALNATTGSWNLRGGIIQNGTVSTTGGAVLTVLTASTLNGVTLNANLSVTGGGLTVQNGLTLGGTMTVTGTQVTFLGTQTFAGSGTVDFAASNNGDTIYAKGGDTTATAATLTIGSGITITSTGTIEALIEGFYSQDSIINQGTIDANTTNESMNLDGATFTNEGTISDTGAATSSPGPSLTITNLQNASGATVSLTSGIKSTMFLEGNWSNSGTIEAPDSSMEFGGTVATGNLGNYSAVDGFIYLTGKLNNQGATLALNNTTGPWYILGGTVDGGTISTTGSAAVYTYRGCVLNGVTLAGNLDLALAGLDDPSIVTVENGLTLNQGSIEMATTAELTFTGTQTLGGTGLITLTSASSGSGLQIPTAANNVILGPDVTIEGNSGFIGASTGGTFTVQGTIEADGGGTLTVQNFTNYAGGTLTGGSWQAMGNSALRLVGANVTTNAANILLGGASSAIDSAASGTTSALAALTTNAAGGTLTIQNGANFNSAAFDNAGTLTVGTGDTFTSTGDYTDGGTTVDNGALAANNMVTVSSGGALSGDGSINAGVVNNGQVTPGDSPGILTISGSYTQGAGATLNIEVGGTTAGTQFDQLDVTGAATLNGTLNVTLINGFGPQSPQTFQFLNFNSLSGAFSTTTMPQIDGNPAFVEQANATNLTLSAAAISADLAFESMTIPSTATPGQNITVHYTVDNLTNVAVGGGWTDSIFVGSSAVFGSSDVLLGRVQPTSVAGFGSYTMSLTAPLPSLNPGNYHVFVEVDSREQVPDENRANNVGVSNTTISLSVPALTQGTSVTGTITSGQSVYYSVTATPGETLAINVTDAVANESEFYASFNALPSRSVFDQTFQDRSVLTPTLVFPNSQGGTYYILLYGQIGAATPQTYTIEAQAAPLGISSFSPTVATNTGTGIGGTATTIGISGTGFTAQSTVALTDTLMQNVVLTPTQLQYTLAGNLNATFNFTNQPTGYYILQVTTGASTATASTQLQILSSLIGGIVSVTATAPSTVPVGGSFPLSINVDNRSNDLAPGPLFFASATGAYPEGSESSETNQLPTFLSPDQNIVEGPSYQTDPSGAGDISTVNVGLLNPSTTPLDWASMESSLQPAGVSTVAWDAVYSNLVAVVGNTYGSLYSLLYGDEQALAEIGIVDNNVSDLFNFEVLKAENGIAVTTIPSTPDISDSVSPLPLTFERTFAQTIPGDYTEGIFGYGWTNNFDATVSTDVATGAVTVSSGGKQESFYQLYNGNYAPVTPGTTDALSVVGGNFQVTETNRDSTTFLSNGKLGSIQDGNGNSIAAGYNGSGQLVTLTDSDGATLTFSYNAQGHVSQISDGNGQTATYTYDATGNYLLSVATAQGTIAYTYSSATSGPTAYEITSVTTPGGSVVNYIYNSNGQLVQQSGISGADPLNYTYGPNNYSVTDANNSTTNFFYDLNGQTVAIQDAVGRFALSSYNANDQIVEMEDGNAAPSTYNYDASGNITAQVDPLGESQQFAYNPGTDQMTSWTDALGNVTSYGYNAAGDLTSTTFASGSTRTIGYNASGEVAQSVDQAGQTTIYTYDSRGDLLSQDTAGQTDTYTYDAQGNLLTATNQDGTTTMTYNSANELTSVTNPNGQTIQYSYNADGLRTQVVEPNLTENYAYNSLGQLQSVTDGNGNLIASYRYDAAGNLAQQTNGNGTYTIYTYDAAGDIQEVVNYTAANVEASFFAYIYNAQHQITAITTLTGVTSYTYDAAGRLTSMTLPNGNKTTYNYDAEGNRTSVVSAGTTTSYQVNDLNEYSSIAGTAQTFDKDGSETSGVGPNGAADYTYNALGQLASVATSQGNWTYGYDALGDLVSSTFNGVTTNYLVDPTLDQVVGEYGSGGQFQEAFGIGMGLTSGVTASGQTYYYSYDAQGNTADLTNSAGSVVNSYVYDPFGNVLTSTGTVANPFTYGGALGGLQQGGGLTFLRARSYDPSQGRFLEPDHSGLFGGTNQYTYAVDNPVSFSDPTGRVATYFQVGFTAVGSANLQVTINGNGDLYITPNFGVGTAGWSLGGGITGDASDNQLSLNLSGSNAAGLGGGVDLIGATNPNNSWADELGSGNVGYSFSSVPGASYSATVGVSIKLFNVGVNFNNLARQLFHVSTKTTQVGPLDPNFLAGPGGYGNAQFIAGDSTLPYVIGFENDPTATAPAQAVTVTEQLDPNLDWSTFQFGDFSIGGVTYDVPTGLQYYSTTIDDRAAAGVFVDVTADFDAATGLVTWTFTSIDPTTLDVPSNPEEGFLPPNLSYPQGQAYLYYSVAAKANLSTGSTISEQANVVFNPGEVDQSSLATNSFVNTIDSGAPTSSVAALPSTEPTSFLLNWSGEDDAGGSGIASYDVYVSDNGGSYTLFQSQTTATSAIFTGAVGDTYSFYSVATDNVGNIQQTPTSPQATTTVQIPTPTVTVNAPNETYNAEPYSQATATVTGIGSVLITDGTVTFTYYLHGSTTALTSAPTDAGTYDVIATFSGDADYGSAQSSIATFIIGQATPSVSVNSPGETYNTQPYSQAVATVTGIGGASITDGTVALTYYEHGSTTALASAPTDAGTYDVVANFSGDTDYASASSSTATFTISQATPTVSVNAPNLAYNSNPYSLATTTVAGVGGATITDGGVALTYYVHGSTTPLLSAPTDAGEYDVVAMFSGDTDYASANSNTVTFTIGQAKPAVTVNAPNETYNAEPYSHTAATVAGIGGASITDGTVSFTYYVQGSTTALASAPTDAGTYDVIANFSGDTDYASAPSNTATFTIDQATPTVTANAPSETYNAQPYSQATAAVTGIGDASITDGMVSFTYYVHGSTTALASTPTDAGTYDVVANFSGDTDYASAPSSSATFTIGQATPTVGVNAPNLPYNGNPYSLATATVTGIGGASITDGTVSFTYYIHDSTTALASAPTGAGTYDVVAIFSGDTNYTSAMSDTATFMIGQPAPTVTVNAPGETYNAQPYSQAAATVTGVGDVLIADGTVTFTYYPHGSTTALASAPTDAGTYDVIANFSGDADYGSAQSNAATFAIGQATPAVTLNAPGETYNAQPYSQATATVSGIGGVTLTNGAVTLTYYVHGSTTALASAPTNAGMYDVVANFSGDTDYASAPSGKSTFTLAQATPNVSVAAPNTAYNTKAYSLAAATVTGVSDTAITDGTVTFTYYLHGSTTALASAPSAIGTYDVIATFSGDTDYASAPSGIATFAITAGTATHFTVSAPSAGTAGMAFNFTVTAQDAFDDTVTGYSGTIQITSSDASATLPVNVTLTNGTGTFSATLKTAGLQTITATDTVNSTIVGVSGLIAVSATAATHFTLSAPTSATVGSPFNFMVTALDPFGNTAAGYTGTVRFTSTDGAANLPVNAILTNGAGTFSATLNTSGNQTITATDTVTNSITGTSGSIVVSAATTSEKLVFLLGPTNGIAGRLGPVAVAVENAKGQLVLSDQSQITLSVAGGPGVLGGTDTVRTFLGVALFTNLNLTKAGPYTLKAMDGADTSAISSGITIVPAAPSKLVFAQQPSNITAGGTISPVLLDIEDQYGNIVTSNTSRVAISLAGCSSGARLNGATTVNAVNGVAVFNNLSMTTAGTYQLEASDAILRSGALSNPFTVSSGPAVLMKFINVSANAVHDKTFSVQVALLDQYGNVATNDSSHVTLSLGTHPKNAILSSATLTAAAVDGIATFSGLSVNFTGSYSLIATDNNGIPLIMSSLFNVT